MWWRIKWIRCSNNYSSLRSDKNQDLQVALSVNLFNGVAFRTKKASKNLSERCMTTRFGQWVVAAFFISNLKQRLNSLHFRKRNIMNVTLNWFKTQNFVIFLIMSNFRQSTTWNIRVSRCCSYCFGVTVVINDCYTHARLDQIVHGGWGPSDSWPAAWPSQTVARWSESDPRVTKFHRPTLTQREFTFNNYYLVLARLGQWIWRTGLTLAEHFVPVPGMGPPGQPEAFCHLDVFRFSFVFSQWSWSETLRYAASAV